MGAGHRAGSPPCLAASTAPSRNSKRISANTAIIVITEFGCTAQINGTVGSDHGTGTVVLLVDRAIKEPHYCGLART